MLEWARLNINAGSLTIVGISIQRWSGNVTNTIQSGDTYLTDATLAMSMDDGKGNIINIWQKDATGGSGSFANVVVDGMSLGDPSVFGSDFFNPPEVK